MIPEAAARTEPELRALQNPNQAQTDILTALEKEGEATKKLLFP